jgi:septal ring factor EnvC (AmiA/AmiB activator)
MKLATAALLTLLSNAAAFAPTPIPHRTTALQSNRSGELDFSKIFLSGLTAATLLTSPLVNNAASSASPTVDPLAKEKSLVLSTKTSLSSAQSAIPSLESSLKEAQALVAKDEAAVKVAEKKVKDTKRTLLSVNDKLAEAKGRPGSDKLVDVLSKDSGELNTRY